MEEDQVICSCMNVTTSAIVNAIKKEGLTTPEQIQDVTLAATACGGCQDFLVDILDEVNA
ncbi:MAG: (2Fe-2S)-binding protein [Bacteroidales bacterium]|jgi:nitrite reductase (NADH) large subunit|nr:(2Fe-2S)-binding protein [Bacteroidales bacterium]